ncbi:MAG: hypothetical protein HC897_07085 [Thermoanaerobaculia bacterium]|nr:hypothetical protein [Thermoanaerobaculia bacterium]
MAISDGERVVMGGDSAGSCLSSSPEVYTNAIPKVFRSGSWVVGFVGSWAVGQVVRHGVELPPPRPAGELLSQVVTEIVPMVRRALTEAGLTGTGTPQQPEVWQVLLATSGEMLTFNPRFEVWQPEPRRVALGSGRLVAYGALEVLHAQHGLALETIVERALDVTSRYVAGVKAPFVLESTVLISRPSKARSSGTALAHA